MREAEREPVGAYIISRSEQACRCPLARASARMRSPPRLASVAWERCYRATDTKLKREVAIKVLPASLGGDPAGPCLPVDEAPPIARPIADALEAAHERGLIVVQHFDEELKRLVPGN